MIRAGWQRRERRSDVSRGGGGQGGGGSWVREQTGWRATTRQRRVAEVFGARDHCAANITASPKITNILERRSSPVIKDGAYERYYVPGYGLAATLDHLTFRNFISENTKNTEKTAIAETRRSIS